VDTYRRGEGSEVQAGKLPQRERPQAETKAIGKAGHRVAINYPAALITKEE
jgi:hypothetical protein